MALEWLLAKDRQYLDRKIGRVTRPHLAERTFSGFQGLTLLPGIPNEVTIRHITTKLPWQTILILSQVNHDWVDAIRSRLVYNARVLSNSTEAIVAINHMSLELDESIRFRPADYFDSYLGPVLAIGLYSVNDRSFHQLPPIPRKVRGIPEGCRCACLDGKIYVLGGLRNKRGPRLPSRKMYVMDLAGRGKWERCADMQFGRTLFGCGVMGGKIYIFGGMSLFEELVPEVYDPNLNMWSEFGSMKLSGRVYCHLTAMGPDELVVHLGQFYDPSYDDGTDTTDQNPKPMVYNRIKDEWRIIDIGHCLCPGPSCNGLCMSINNQVTFTAQAKFHQMSWYEVCVFDPLNETKPWTPRCGISWLFDFGTTTYKKWTPLAVDNELVAILDLETVDPSWNSISCERLLVFSTGFGDWKENIVWEKAGSGSNSFRIEAHPFMSVVKL